MADDFKHVQPGDALSIPAAAWNTLLDVARATRTGAGPGAGSSRQASIIRVKNESGGDLLRNSVLGLGDPIFTPADASEDAFLREVTFRGLMPDLSRHAKRFCVLLDPAPIDGVVRAYLAGVCPVLVDVLDDRHEYATVAGVAEHLNSSRYGFAQILWREGDEAYGYGDAYDTGLQWAIVRLGAHCPSVAVGKANGDISSLGGSTFGTGKVDIYRSDGGTVDGPVETIDPVKNPGGVISDGKWVSIAWDMDGTAFVGPLECE